ncbi:MAG: cytochrome c [Chloroflexi bacterium]|nr:cytochrome c [Chloroflexota bacterium]
MTRTKARTVERASTRPLALSGKERRLRLLVPLGLAAAAMTLTACSVGAYPVDYFQEMHYSPAVRLQEPPRLSPPPGAIAFRGVGAEAEMSAPPAYDLMARVQLEAVTRNPLPDTRTVRDQGAALFARNCAVCHGERGDGKPEGGRAIIPAVFTAAGALPPADLMAPATRARTDGALFAIITHGLGVVPMPADAKDPEAYKALTNMPAWRKLLTPDQRWALVRHIRALQGQ